MRRTAAYFPNFTCFLLFLVVFFPTGLSAEDNSASPPRRIPIPDSHRSELEGAQGMPEVVGQKSGPSPAALESVADTKRNEEDDLSSNRPPGFFERHPRAVQIAGVVLALLSIVIVALFVNLRQRERFLKHALRQERQKLELETKYAAVLATTSDAVIATDLEGDIALFNPGAEQLYECSEGDALGSNIARFCPQERREEQAALLRKVRETGSVKSIETERLTARGRKVPVEMTLSLRTDESGAPSGITAIMRDIAERKRAEEALRRSEEQYRTVVEMAPEPVFIHQEGRFVYANPATLALLGAEKEEDLLGRSPMDFIDEEFKETVHRRIADITRGRRRVPFMEQKIRRVDGGTAYVESAAIPCLYNGKQAVQVFARDVTERKRAEEALRQSEATLNEAQEIARVGSFVWDLKTDTLQWSRHMFAIAGLDPDAFYGNLQDTVANMIHPEDRESVRRQIAAMVEQKLTWPMEFRLVRPDGEVRRLRSGSRFTLDESGVPAGCIGVHHDITEHHRIQRDYELLFKEMLNGFALHEIVCDEEGNPVDYRFLAVNPAFEKMTGLRGEDLVGRTVLEVLPGTEKHWIETYGRVALKGEDARFESYSGEIGKHYLVTAYQTLPGQFACILEDVTERKRSEETLRASEERYRILFERAHDAIFIADPDTGILLDVNRAAEELTGYARGELVGRHQSFLHPPQEEEVYKRNFREAVRSPGKRFLEVEVIGREGRRTPVEISSGGTIGLSGQRLHVGFFRDIAERKQAEEERKRLQAQLHQAQKMESVGRLAGGVAHDFNNMLSVILGHTELALEQVEPEHPLLENLREIAKAANRSADLTRQLLAFARKQAIAPQVLDLNETVEGMLKMLRRLIGEDIDLVWRPAPQLWRIEMDPSQIDQILANLCVNARDAIDGIGRIVIRTDMATLDETRCSEHAGASPGDFVVLGVGDDGCGMDGDTLDKLFEPFFTTKEVGQGTGLGLATVYGIVRQNKGFIDVRSEPGKGTIFNIHLPRHTDETEPVHPKSPATPVRGGGEVVLLVEDEPSILEMTREMLEKLGYAVLAAGTPSQAVRLAEDRSGGIQLLVTDVIMPEMNGRDLAKKLISRHPDLKCLFMSGYTDDVIADRGALEEGGPFIHKPFSVKALAAKIREILDD